MTTLIQEPTARRHDIDWVRTLAFSLLILYHIGMYFVADWGWHIKSNYQSESLQVLMSLVNPWRMPLIFLISGVALAAVQNKLNQSALVRIRTTRLLIPAIICSYLVVWPQAFYEAQQYHQYSGSAWAFFLEYLNPNTSLLPEMHHSPLGLFTWNHLWYLVYLWFYTLLFIVLKPMLLKAEPYLQRLFQHAHIGLPLLVLWITTIELFLAPRFPTTHALIDDWYNHARYFSLMVLGYVSFRSDCFFEKLAKARFTLLVCAVVLSALSIAIRSDSLWWQWGRLAPLMVLVSSALICIFSIFGYGYRYLNRPSKLLDYMNQAVLPWYIVHQTLIIIIASAIKPISAGPVWEPMIITVGTLLGCFMSFEIIKRFTALRMMFGLKRQNAKK